jgi:hypothetical protein
MGSLSAAATRTSTACLIACNYQRNDEKPATHWRDVWERRLGSKVRRRILQRITSRGRRSLLSVRANVRESGASIQLGESESRRQLGSDFSFKRPIDYALSAAGYAPLQVGFCRGWAVYDFLRLVLPPLERHLRKRALSPVTVDKIVRLVTEDLPQSRRAAR